MCCIRQDRFQHFAIAQVQVPVVGAGDCQPAACGGRCVRVILGQVSLLEICGD